MAADLELRTEGLPALQLWDTVLPNPATLSFQEDNKATIPILKTGKDPTLRHLYRTHRVNVCWLSEVFRDFKEVESGYCETGNQAAYFLTKGFVNPAKWSHACKLIGIL